MTSLLYSPVTATLVPSLILLVGVIDDLRSRKVHNRLFLACLGAALSFVLLRMGWSGFYQVLLSLSLCLGLLLPLVFVKMLGGGDLKLMVAFSLVCTPMEVFWVIAYSLVWGALLGLFQVILRGQAKELLNNTVKMATLRKPDETQLHRIPFTVALLFGWLTQLSLNGWQGGLG